MVMGANRKSPALYIAILGLATGFSESHGQVNLNAASRKIDQFLQAGLQANDLKPNPMVAILAEEGSDRDSYIQNAEEVGKEVEKVEEVVEEVEEEAETVEEAVEEVD